MAPSFRHFVDITNLCHLTSVCRERAKHSCARNNLILGDYFLPSGFGARIVQKLVQSCSCTFVEPQHASKARSTIDPLCFRILDLDRRDQLVVEALMFSLKVIMIHIFPQGAAKRGRADRYEFR